MQVETPGDEVMGGETDNKQPVGAGLYGLFKSVFRFLQARGITNASCYHPPLIFFSIRFKFCAVRQQTVVFRALRFNEKIGKRNTRQHNYAPDKTTKTPVSNIVKPGNYLQDNDTKNTD